MKILVYVEVLNWRLTMVSFVSLNSKVQGQACLHAAKDG